MPSKPSSGISPAQLRAAFTNDLAAAWNHAKSLHPDHTPYAFVLYGVEDRPRLTPHVLTEESLTQVAQRYVKEGYYDTLDEARKNLRYSVADSPLFDELEDKVPAVDGILSPHEATLDESAGYGILAKGAMAALKKLDEQGTFGNAEQRDRLVLAIITEDTEKDWSKTSVKKLNPPMVARRFAADTKVKGKLVICKAMDPSPDGLSLYSAGTRATDVQGTQFVSEIVAFEIALPRLKRRWSFSFPAWGDSGCAVACARDGKAVLILRCKRPATVIMRFGYDSNTVVQQAQMPGEPASFALSQDGSRLAVIMHNGELHVLDESLRVLRSLKVASAGRCVTFLGSGDLLVGTDAGMIRVDREFNARPTAYTEFAFVIAADAANKIVAVSRWFEGCTQREERREFGIQIRGLPSLELLRTILIPGHQAVTAAISPDGRYVAFEAHEILKRGKFVAVCETATGREIARRRSHFVHDLRFLADGQTLAIAESDTTPAEAIALWAWAKH